MVRQAQLYFFFFTLLFVVGCEEGNNVEDSDNSKPVFNEQEYAEIIDPNNTFGFALLDNVDPDENENIFISPTSAFMALLMAYNGAEDETKEEMAKTFSIHELSQDEVNNANLSLQNLLEKETEEVELQIANSMWLNDKYHFTDEFSQRMSKYFEAEVSEIDISDDASVERINRWVSEATKEKIEKIIEKPIHPNV